MIYQIYEWRLLRYLDNIPQVICFMISDEEMENDPEQIERIIRWCSEISDKVRKNNSSCPGIKEIIIHISTSNPDEVPGYLSYIRSLSSFVSLDLHYGDNTERSGAGIPVTVAIGKSGREEIADAIQSMALDNVSSKDVTPELLEKYLTFSHSPDFMIKTGGAHLVDFLIWQSVYSELFFLDLNWERIRKIDLVRAFRDYLSRSRRFGS